MEVKNLTMTDFESTVRSNPIVLVDFWAPWCNPCRGFAPVFERSARDHPRIVYAKVNIDAERDLAATLGIRSVPTTMAFREGILVYSRPGAMPPVVLKNLIDQVKSLDMATVRAKIAVRKSATATA